MTTHPTPSIAASAAAVSAGGIAGALARWGVVETLETDQSWPWHVLLVNVVGCAILGLLFANRSRLTHSSWLILATGFCGSFTTFSAFAVDLSHMLRDDGYGEFASYTGVSLVFGVAAFWAALSLGRQLGSGQ